MENGTNPVTGMDFPDPDIIRVGDTYYMISTTMHFFPGGQILKSHDLIHWEFCAYVYDRLGSTTGEILEDEEEVYGHGMWAASLRYHDGRFYVVFIAHEHPKTFLFTADRIEGPWEKHYVEGIYHDPSLFFDDDGKIYIVYGNREIRLTELSEDLSGPKKGGLDRIIIKDAPGAFLGYEGSHLYKIGGHYLLFLIHSLQSRWHRTQACFITDDPADVWAGGDVLCDDLDGLDAGPAQGGIVDTPEGKWYAILFQDRGAVGRIPVLVPIRFNEFGYPVFEKVKKEITCESTRPGWQPKPLYADDDFMTPEPAAVWQFNHEPRSGCWNMGEGVYEIRTDKVSRNLLFARNTLTQRTILPGCSATVTVDAKGIKEGDVTGLCLLIGSYALIGITKRGECFYPVMIERSEPQDKPAMAEAANTSGDNNRKQITEKEYIGEPLSSPALTLHADVRFEGFSGYVTFSYETETTRHPLGPVHRMEFTLEHFTGCRFGLFLYSTREIGGITAFSSFRYSVNDI